MNNSNPDLPNEAEDEELQANELEEASGGASAAIHATGAFGRRSRTPLNDRVKTNKPKSDARFPGETF